MHISLTTKIEEAAIGYAQLEAGQTVEVTSKVHFTALLRDERCGS